MAGEQPPAPAVFDECVGKLKLEIEQFPAGDSFCVRLPRSQLRCRHGRARAVELDGLKPSSLRLPREQIPVHWPINGQRL